MKVQLVYKTQGVPAGELVAKVPAIQHRWLGLTPDLGTNHAQAVVESGFGLWEATITKHGVVVVTVTHPKLPTGFAFDPELEPYPSLDSVGEIVEEFAKAGFGGTPVTVVSSYPETSPQDSEGVVLQLVR